MNGSIDDFQSVASSRFQDRQSELDGSGSVLGLGSVSASMSMSMSMSMDGDSISRRQFRLKLMQRLHALQAQQRQLRAQQLPDGHDREADQGAEFGGDEDKELEPEYMTGTKEEQESANYSYSSAGSVGSQLHVTFLIIRI